MLEFIKKYGLLLVIVVSFFVVLIRGAVVVSSLEKKNIELQNEIVSRDKTIEVQKDLYRNSSLRVGNLESLLAENNVHEKLLLAEINKRDEQIAEITKLVVFWKKKYESVIDATQSDVPGTSQTVRKRVDFNKDFGYIGIKGFTMTDPAYAYVSIQQNRPLRLVLALSQDKDMKWHANVSSSEEDIGVNIEVSAVSKYIVMRKWYEKISIIGEVGASSSGALFGVGVKYQLGKFSLGPSVWSVVADRTFTFFGGSLEWRPFERE
jgi:hypothetical protein